MLLFNTNSRLFNPTLISHKMNKIKPINNLIPCLFFLLKLEMVLMINKIKYNMTTKYNGSNDLNIIDMLEIKIEQINTYIIIYALILFFDVS